MNICRMHFAAACLVLAMLATQAQAQLPAEYVAHLKAAKNAARFDWVGVLARNCIEPKVGPLIGNYNADPGRAIWFAERQKVFDNLYFLGTKFHTAWALTTGDGIIIIDTLYYYASEPEITQESRTRGYGRERRRRDRGREDAAGSLRLGDTTVMTREVGARSPSPANTGP